MDIRFLRLAGTSVRRYLGYLRDETEIYIFCVVFVALYGFGCT